MTPLEKLKAHLESEALSLKELNKKFHLLEHQHARWQYAKELLSLIKELEANVRDDHCPGWTPNDSDEFENLDKGGFPLLVKYPDDSVALIMNISHLPVGKTFTVLRKTSSTMELQLWQQAWNEGYQKAKNEDRDNDY